MGSDSVLQFPKSIRAGEADLRRADSAAYYSLFHLLTTGGGLFAAQGAEQLGEGRHAGERKPVLVGIGDFGLLLNGVGEIGEGEALGFQPMPGDAPGKGDRLEAEIGR